MSGGPSKHSSGPGNLFPSSSLTRGERISGAAHLKPDVLEIRASGRGLDKEAGGSERREKEWSPHSGRKRKRGFQNKEVGCATEIASERQYKEEVPENPG